MKKTIKYSILTAIFTVALMSCGSRGNAQNNAAVQPKTKEEVQAILTNFDISMVFDVEGERYAYRQASNDKGTYFETRSGIDYYDFTQNIGYDLDVDEKSGEFFPIEHSEMYKGFHYIVASHLFRHLDNKELQTIVGRETIIGRPTTVYMVDLREYSAGYSKVWVDDEYGFTLQYEQFESYPMKFYVTKFTVGGVNVEGLVNLAEYKLEEYVEENWFDDDWSDDEIVEGVLSIAAMKKAAADAGFTVREGTRTQSNWTTDSKSKAEPVNGFMISVRQDGFNFMGIAILQHSTEEIAREYIEFHKEANTLYNEADIIYVDSIHRSGVFTVVIDSSLKNEHEANLLEALKKAGWE